MPLAQAGQAQAAIKSISKQKGHAYRVARVQTPRRGASVLALVDQRALLDPGHHITQLFSNFFNSVLKVLFS